MEVKAITNLLKTSDDTFVWKIRAILNGGPGSGNWGHVGIPGWRGGSQAGSGGVHARPDNYKEKNAERKAEKGKGVKDTGGINEDGTVKGVEYFHDEYTRAPGYGEMHPLASPEGINKMQKDLADAGSKTGIVSASETQIKKLVSQLNAMPPEARANNLNKMAKHFLEITGAPNGHNEIEKQLNRWGLSGISRTYSPKASAR